MTTATKQARLKQIMRDLRDAMRDGHVHISCFRNADGTPAHPMIAELDALTAELEASS